MDGHNRQSKAEVVTFFEALGFRAGFAAALATSATAAWNGNSNVGAHVILHIAAAISSRAGVLCYKELLPPLLVWWR